MPGYQENNKEIFTTASMPGYQENLLQVERTLSVLKNSKIFTDM